MTNLYDYALGLFTSAGFPDSIAVTLANIAVFYCYQTGKTVETLILEDGQLDPTFLASVNSVKNTNNQFGVLQSNPTPVWSNKIVLTASVREALNR